MSDDWIDDGASTRSARSAGGLGEGASTRSARSAGGLGEGASTRSARSASGFGSEDEFEPDELEVVEPLEPDDDIDVAAHDETGLDLATRIAHSARGAKPGSRRKKKQRPFEVNGTTFSGARRDDRDPKPLADILGRFSDERGWDATVSVHLLLARWQVLVGPMVAQHSHPESFDDGVLLVRTDSTAWATQLRLMAPNLLAALNAEVGDGTVRLIRVLGPDAPSWKHGSRTVSDGRGPRDTYG